MMDMTLTSALLLAMSCCGLVKASTDTPCAVGWFGESCQYKCHCIRNACDEQGECTPGSKCVRGWFGASCQYKDLLGSYQTVPEDEEFNILDGDDESCADDLLLMTLRFNEVPVTWFRLVVRKLVPESLSNLTVWIRQREDEDCFVYSRYAKCDETTTVIVDHRTVDVYCSTTGNVHELLLAGSAIKNLCSLYVSEGRNVALKQPTWQSSTLGLLIGNASAAVDGNTSGLLSDNRCSHTALDDSSPRWTVRFPTPVLINKFKIFNRQDCCSERLLYFSLKTFTASNDTVADFTSTSEDTTEVNTVSDPSHTEPVSYLTLAARNPWQGHTVLTLCEVEAYGDTVCPGGRFGKSCERTCNCSTWGEACMVSSGNCPSGCASGRYGEGCTLECPPLLWGVDCLRKCSRHCVNQECDMYTGYCLHGCEDGYRPRDCTRVCEVGRWGGNCLRTCPENCSDGRCTPVDGKCYSCVPGFHGVRCFAACTPGKYGAACKSRCPRRCAGRTCNHVTGHCHQCEPGYDGDRCENRVN